MEDNEVKFINKNDLNNNNNNDNEEIIKNIKINRKLIFATIVYVLFQFIFTGFIAMILASIYSQTHQDVEYMELIKALSETEFAKISEAYKGAYVLINCYTNFISYTVVFIFVIILCKELFIEDFFKLLKNPKFYFIYIILAAILFSGISYLVDVGVTKLVSSLLPSDKSSVSQNQAVIEAMLKSENGWMICIMTIILAPVIEEIVYRGLIFRLTKKYHVALSYALSIVLFSLPHMISTPIASVGFGIWLLQSIPYVTAALLFCIIYHKSNYNIYSNIFAHIVNNIMAVLQVYLIIIMR